MRSDFAASLDARRLAVVAALQAVRAEPVPAVHAEVAALRTEVRRLTDRLERVEHKVELVQAREDAPLSWPVAVNADSDLEVPPFEVSRKSSPAFDVLLGPGPDRA